MKPFVGSRMGCSMKHVEMMAPVKNGSHPTGSVCYQYMSWLTRLIVVECGVCTRSGYAMQEGISTAKPAADHMDAALNTAVFIKYLHLIAAGLQPSSPDLYGTARCQQSCLSGLQIKSSNLGFQIVRREEGEKGAMRGSTSGIRSLGGIPGLIGRYLGLQGRKHQIFIGLFICTVATHIFVNRARPILKSFLLQELLGIC